MKKILILSVPHTGTVFTRTYVNEILKVPRSRGIDAFSTAQQQVHFNIHPVNNRSAKVVRALQYAEENCNVIIPLRNPIDNAISCLKRGHKNNDYCIQNWRKMIDVHTSLKHVYFVDVWTAKENRRNMMLGLNNFLSIEPEQEAFDDFIKLWEKQNENAKPKPVPDNIDLIPLQFAVQWYNDMKIKLDKQYSMPLPMD